MHTTQHSLQALHGATCCLKSPIFRASPVNSIGPWLIFQSKWLKITLCAFYLLFFSLTVSATDQAEINDESALYAITSLRCHINQELNMANQSLLIFEKIHFTELDVTKLWQQAKLSTEASSIEKAESLWRDSRKHSDRQETYSALHEARYLIDKAWEKLNPYCTRIVPKPIEDHRYLLPNEHWLKYQLDSIFTQWDVLKNDKILAAAGFEVLCKRSSSMIVAKHEKIPDYLVKLYLQNDKGSQAWSWMINRCSGAENIRNLIKAKKLRYFTVPDKWIYPLPGEHVENLAVLPEETAPAVLVVTHMKIGDYTYSKEAWRTVITRKHLRELYCILSHGFASCYLAQNIPYTRDGIFACLDTEYPYRIHRLEKVRGHLSPKMKIYWERLIRTGGKG